MEEVTKMSSGLAVEGTVHACSSFRSQCHVCGIIGYSLRLRNKGLAVDSSRGGQALPHEGPYLRG